MPALAAGGPSPARGPGAGKRLLLALAPAPAAAVLGALTATWRVTEAGHTGESPRARPKGGRIFAIWHETAPTAACYGGLRVHALASRSFDGELISRVLARLGWLETARGSSSRGGGTGLKELAGYLERGDHVLLTVDGPRGPRRRAKDGPLQLARLTGRPVVPVGFACRPALRLRSWDRMAIPAPFARGVYWFGRPLPPARGVAALEGLQRALDLATESAEDLLRAG